MSTAFIPIIDTEIYTPSEKQRPVPTQQPTQQNIAVTILYKDLIQKNSELQDLIEKMKSTHEKELKALNKALSCRDLEIKTLKQENVVLQKTLSEKETAHARLLVSDKKKTETVEKKLTVAEAKANLYQNAFKNFEEITDQTLKKRATLSYLGSFIENTVAGKNTADFDEIEFSLFKALAYECSQITALRQEVLATRKKELTL